MTIHYLHNDDWAEFLPSDYLIIYQDATTAIKGLMGKIPVVINHDGAYYCSKSVFSQVRKKHKKVATFDSILSKIPPNTTFGRLFNVL